MRCMHVPALLNMSHGAPAKDPLHRSLAAAELDVQRLQTCHVAARVHRVRVRGTLAVSFP